MNDLIKFQAQRIATLEQRNAYLENELKQAKELFQALINEWEVKEPEVLEFPKLDIATKVFDEIFQKPIDQINKLI